MKVFACFTESHRAMLRDHFLDSLPSDLELVLQQFPQECRSGQFASSGFWQTCRKKMEFITVALNVETEPFLFADVDVRFYGDVSSELLKQLGDDDIAFQSDGPGGACTGIFVVRPNDRTRAFFAAVVRDMYKPIKDRWFDGPDVVSQREPISDQDVVWRALMRNAMSPSQDDPIWKLLDEKFWTFGRDGHEWKPGVEIKLPKGILVHHANWCSGVPRKHEMLGLVKRLHDGGLAAIPPAHMIERAP